MIRTTLSSKLVGLALLGIILVLYVGILLVALYTGDGLIREIARTMTSIIGLLPLAYLFLTYFRN
jgi:hypothetical protein